MGKKDSFGDNPFGGMFDFNGDGRGFGRTMDRHENL